MLSRDTIITMAWLRLGDQNQMYNANITERQKVADMLFDQVKSDVGVDTTFLFNATTVALTKNLNSQEGDYIRYNLPADFVSKVRCSDRLARFEGEYIYSTADDLELTYCREMDLSEYPEYLERYFIVSLAIKLAMAYKTLSDNIQFLSMERVDEMNRIVTREGLPFEIER